MSLSWIKMMLLSGNDEQFGTGMYFFRKIAKWHNLWVFTQKCWQIFAGGREREVRIQKNTILYHLVLSLTPPHPPKNWDHLLAVVSETEYQFCFIGDTEKWAALASLRQSCLRVARLKSILYEGRWAVLPGWGQQSGPRTSANGWFIQHQLVKNRAFNMFLTGMVSGFKIHCLSMYDKTHYNIVKKLASN